MNHRPHRAAAFSFPVLILLLSAAPGCGSSSGAASASSGCHDVGDDMSCNYASSTTPGTKCPFVSSGSCASQGLVGCCVTTTPEGGNTVITATCYYQAASAATAKAACTGAEDAWSTSAP